MVRVRISRELKLLAIILMVSLWTSGCMTKEEVAQATRVAMATQVKQAEETIVRSGTPMPTWTPIPPTLTPSLTSTPKPTATPSRTPTATPFTGWVKYTGNGQELTRHNAPAFTPPPPLAGENGEQWVHYSKGNADYASEPTPWWKGPLITLGIVIGAVAVLFALVFFVVILPNRNMQEAMISRLAPAQQALPAPPQQLQLTTGRDSFESYLRNVAEECPEEAKSLAFILERVEKTRRLLHRE